MTVMTRQALLEAAWERPLTAIAEELGITSTGLRKICDRHGVPTPGRGYWAQVYSGKTFPRPKLRPIKDPSLDEVRIVGARPLSPAVSEAIKKAKALASSEPAKRRWASPSPVVREPERVDSPESGPTHKEAEPAPPLRKDLDATSKAISRAKLNSDGFGSASGNAVIRLKVSPEAQGAALTFLGRLLDQAQERGWFIQSSQEGAKLVVEGEAIKFRVEEQPHKTPHTPTERELALKKDRDRWGGDSQPWSTWDLSPSGRLALIIEENNYSGLRRTYSQRKGYAFEDSLDVILTGFAAHIGLDRRAPQGGRRESQGGG